MKAIPRIGIGGPVGAGKTAVIQAITPILVDIGVRLLIVTNDVASTEDADYLQQALDGILSKERIIGVETGGYPHTAVGDNPRINLVALEALQGKFPNTDLVLLESGGDSLALTFSPALIDFSIYVIDVAAGERIPRKNGLGITQSDILVINKIDLARCVGANLDVMARDARAMRGPKPFVFTDCLRMDGIPELVRLIRERVLSNPRP